ncbi:hypothetical protein ILYODFUR_005392 [Ilyodon furcidens]|uniref:Uncharacterized protein n=1 Tax=Ilyodon furcidens TaxID=33524 RepID=A0ABV0TTX2_9TELE
MASLHEDFLFYAYCLEKNKSTLPKCALIIKHGPTSRKDALSRSFVSSHEAVLWIGQNCKLNLPVIKHVPICNAYSSSLSVGFNPTAGQSHGEEVRARGKAEIKRSHLIKTKSYSSVQLLPFQYRQWKNYYC